MTDGAEQTRQGFNPFRSEADMFRVLVAVVIVAIPVIAVGLLAGPVWALLVLLFETGIAIGAGVRARSRRSGGSATEGS